VRDTANNGYRFSDIVLGIVNSVPFEMRAKPKPTVANDLRIERGQHG
jgi:hypothetical protein